MSIFDLFFLCVVLGSLVTLIATLVAAVRGERRHAMKLLRSWAIFITLYLATVDIVAVTLPTRVLSPGDLQCSDDWCISVANVKHAEHNGTNIDIDLRLTSRARRVAQREKGLVVYLKDAQGARYDPLPDASEVPLDTQLQAGESVIATRHFTVPPNPGPLNLVVTREGFQMGWLIIGRGPFDRRTSVRID